MQKGALAGSIITAGPMAAPMVRRGSMGELDRVQWNELELARGTASDVPRLLRSLAAGSSDSIAIVQLQELLLEDGRVYEATSLAIPYLLELLHDGPPTPRASIVRCVRHLALREPDLFPETLDPSEADPVLHRTELACFFAAEEGVDVVLPWVMSNELDVALEAVAYVASFPRLATRSLPTLNHLLQQLEVESKLLGPVLVALARLGDPCARPNAERFLGACDASLAIHAACACILANPESVRDRVVAILSSRYGESERETSPWTGELETLVNACVAMLPPKHHPPFVPAMARALATGRQTSNAARTALLLDLVFPQGPAPETAHALTAVQRAALMAIAEHGAFRENGRDARRYIEILAAWNLPTKRESLITWLTSAPTPIPPPRRPSAVWN